MDNECTYCGEKFKKGQKVYEFEDRYYCSEWCMTSDVQEDHNTFIYGKA